MMIVTARQRERLSTMKSRLASCDPLSTDSAVTEPMRWAILQAFVIGKICSAVASGFWMDKCVRSQHRAFLTVILLLFASIAPSFADTNAQDDYLKRDWETFHRLFDKHNFKTKDCLLDRCAYLLKKFQTGDFTFLLPLEHGDTPQLPEYVRMRKHCRHDLGILSFNNDPIPLAPQRGFALYKVPANLTRPKVKDLYLLRSEDYTDPLGGIKLVGAFVPFTYPECHSLKEVLFHKTEGTSPAVPTPTQSDSLIEPIVVDDVLLIMDLYIIDSGNEPPLYVLTVWSIPAPTALTGEMYYFNGR